LIALIINTCRRNQQPDLSNQML